jgi:TatD DNase family protein
MIIDTHCHYNLEPLYLVPEDQQIIWPSHWQKAQEYGVTKSVVVGVNFFTSGTAIDIAEQHNNLFAAVGCHPGHYTEQIREKIKITPGLTLENCLVDIQTDRNELSLIVDKPKVVAIGEIGLDYYHLDDEPLTPEQKQIIIEVQKAAYKMQVELSQEYSLPIIIHVRDKSDAAYKDALEILRSTQFQSPFILHCVSGTPEYITEALNLGAFFGIAGNVTYKNADNLRALIKMIPKDRLVLETDAPYLAPSEFRGKVCEPWMISKTAEFVETQLEIKVDQLSTNAETVLHI